MMDGTCFSLFFFSLCFYKLSSKKKPNENKKFFSPKFTFKNLEPDKNTIKNLTLVFIQVKLYQFSQLILNYFKNLNYFFLLIRIHIVN